MSKGLPIGALSARTGVKVPTIRYYESVGLLPMPERTESNRRTYRQDAVRRLRFIRHARELDFDVDAIRQLIELAGQYGMSCAHADALARAHLANIESKIARLTALRRKMRRMIHGCTRGTVETCKVIDVLADHGQCLHATHLVGANDCRRRSVPGKTLSLSRLA